MVAANRDVEYALGGIPDLPAWVGTPLAFRIGADSVDAASAIEMAVDRQPAGVLQFDIATARFRYEAAPEDRVPFTVTLSGTRQGKAIRQSFVITPVPQLPAERDYIASNPATPDPASSLYLHRSAKPNADGSEDHTVTGVRIVFDRSHDANGLHAAYHVDRARKLADEPDPKGTVRHLTLCADQVVVRGALSLPETDVAIFARELAFEDLDDEPGCIDTSPLGYALEKAADAQRNGSRPGQDGRPGRRGGSASVYLKTLRLPPAAPEPKRFVLRGGNGQHAGIGDNGQNGRSCASVTSMKTDCGSKALTANFNPPAIYWKSHCKWGWSDTQGSWGTPNGFPSSGTDALSAGKPGDGGDGGAFTTNLPLTKLVDNGGGMAGNPGQDVVGGKAGEPRKSAQYEVTVWNNWIHGPHFDGKQPQLIGKPHDTVDGKSFAAPQAAKPQGAQAQAEVVDCANAWLHPLLLQSALQFVRDAYLAEDRATVAALLAEYRDALLLEPPARTGWGGNFDLAGYYAAQAEVVTLAHRLASHLDYYGNPCGWTPLLSLRANLQRYENEITGALRTLVLVAWIDRKANASENAAAAMNSAIVELDRDADDAVKEVQAAEKGLKEINDHIYSLMQELDGLTRDLTALRDKLLTEAHNNQQRKALINFGVKTFSALCSVIPYGQPVLGTVGSVANVIGDYATTDETPIDAAGKLGGVLAAFGKAKLDEKASEIGKAAAKKKADPEADKAKEKAARLAHVGKTIGPALGQVTDAIKGLRVPQEEVDAELARLAAKTPEFADMVDKIQALNVRKTAFAETLDETLQAFGGAYGRVTSNLNAIGSLAQQERETLAHLDHEAVLFTRDLGQRARQTLVKYLYYLIKSYETSIMKPVDSTNYQLTDVFDKISDLLQAGEEGATLDVTQLGAFAEQLMPIFRDNLGRIEQMLLADFRPEYTVTLESRLSTDQTPTLIRQLNEAGEAVINLRDSGLILPDREKIRIADIEVGGLGFGSQTLPAGGTLEITLEPLGDGTIRADDRLYAVRHPANSGQGDAEAAAPGQIWGASYHFSNQQLSPIKPSSESLALLGYLLHSADDKTKENLAKPAAWTDLRIRFRRYTADGPNLENLLLTWHLNFTQPTTSNRFVLDIRSDGPAAPLIECSPSDINDRSDGFGSLYRLYRRATPVTVTVPAEFGEFVFDHWEIINTDTMKREIHRDPSCKLGIENNLRLTCRYLDRIEAAIAAAPKMFTARIAGPFGDELAEPGLMQAHPAFSSSILSRPSLTEGVMRGYLPDDAEFVTLEGPREQDGHTWYKIDLAGTVGWVHQLAE